jgi:hypothetical protein
MIKTYIQFKIIFIFHLKNNTFWKAIFHNIISFKKKQKKTKHSLLLVKLMGREIVYGYMIKCNDLQFPACIFKYYS